MPTRRRFIAQSAAAERRVAAGAAHLARRRIAHRHPARRADCHDCAGDLRSLRRAPRRRRVRRHLGGRGIEDPERRRHSHGAGRAPQAHQRARRALAGRVLRRQLRLARRHRSEPPRGRAARTSGSTPRCRPGRSSTTRTRSARSSSSASAAWPARSPIWPRTFAACRRATSISGSSSATRRPAPRRWPTRARRRARGSRSTSRYWGVGNEPWGCGGDFSPEDYAAEFRRFTSWVPGFDVGLRFIGAGPSGPEFEWTRRFFAKLTEESKGLVRRLVGLVGAPLLDQRQRRPVERLERKQGAGHRLHARAVVRAAEGRRPSRRLHRRPRPGAERVRPAAPSEAGDRRVGLVA